MPDMQGDRMCAVAVASTSRPASAAAALPQDQLRATLLSHLNTRTMRSIRMALTPEPALALAVQEHVARSEHIQVPSTARTM